MRVFLLNYLFKRYRLVNLFKLAKIRILVINRVAMITITSAEAQSRFGELIDRSQREPVAVTRHGRTVAYVVSEHDLQALADVNKRRADAARWYANYRANVQRNPAAVALTDDDVNKLVHELR
jgi:antitoxin Phd